MKVLLAVYTVALSSFFLNGCVGSSKAPALSSDLASITIQKLNAPGYTTYTIQMQPLTTGSTFTMTPQSVPNNGSADPINIKVPPGKYQVGLNYLDQTGSTIYSADYCTTTKNNTVTLVAGNNNFRISVCQNNANPVGEAATANVTISPVIGNNSSGGTTSQTTPVTIVNNQNWTDTSGNPIKAQGGGMFKVNDTYYWVGSSMNNSVKCYSSKDLAHWKYENDALQKNGWIGRPDVAYNAASSKYVMIIEWSNGSGRNIPAYLTSDTPCGNYTWVRAEQNVFGYSMGDHSVFQDADGQAYLVYTFDQGGQNGSMGVASLTSDYLGLQSSIATFTNGGGSCEAGNIAKVGSTYYLFSSGCKWWNSTATMYRTSTDLVHWTNVQQLNTNPNSGDSFNTQTDFIITVTGSQTTSYIYAGDRYSEYTHTGVGLNAWYPLTFDGSGTPTLNGLDKWTIDVGSGTWNAAN